MKKIAFLSNGCQVGFGQVREIVAAHPDCRETRNPQTADILMVNLCAISTESLNEFEQLRQQIIHYKESNPQLTVIAGGCIKGHSTQYDLAFADAIFEHQKAPAALVPFLEQSSTARAPHIVSGIAEINICLGCNNHCTFCKVHYLNDRKLTSRPIAEILNLAKQATAGGVSTIALSAENSTEYGTDLGTNLQTLLEQLLALDGLRFLDVHGLCLDEVTPDLLEILKHPKIRMLQLEVQSLNDQIRKNMGLHKTTQEALNILDALSNKYLVSNLMVGFPGHSIAEYIREMRLISNHHLYYLTLDPYDDTDGTPSHKLYQPPSTKEKNYYYETFLHTVARERQMLLDKLLKMASIEATVTSSEVNTLQLYASHYSVQIHAKHTRRHYHLGDVVQVKITGLYSNLPNLVNTALQTSAKNNPKAKSTVQLMQYFDTLNKEQTLLLSGEIIDTTP